MNPKWNKKNKLPTLVIYQTNKTAALNKTKPSLRKRKNFTNFTWTKYKKGTFCTVVKPQ